MVPNFWAGNDNTLHYRVRYRATPGDSRHVYQDSIKPAFHTASRRNFLVDYMVDSRNKNFDHSSIERSSRLRAESPEVAAFNNAPLGMLVAHQLSGEIIKANAAACEFFGYAEEDLSARSFTTLCCPSERDQKAGLLDTSASTRERRFVHRRGHVIWARTSIANLSKYEDAKDLVVIQIQDTNELKSADSQFSSLDGAFGTAFETSPLPSAIVDSCGRITAMNPRMQSVLSRGFDSLADIALGTLVKCGEEASNKLAEFFSGKVKSIEAEVVLFNGHACETLASISLARVGAGSAPRVFAVLHVDSLLGSLNTPDEQAIEQPSNVVPLERSA